MIGQLLLGDASPSYTSGQEPTVCRQLAANLIVGLGRPGCSSIAPPRYPGIAAFIRPNARDHPWMQVSRYWLGFYVVSNWLGKLTIFIFRHL